MAKYTATIGLEVHCQLATLTKLFCGCPNIFGSPVNENICAVCLGHPGSLPVLNTRAVDFAIKLALAVGAKIQRKSQFARKQYFYPDLPKGYQISQHDQPYCQGGEVYLDSGKKVALHRIHLEEDAGKNIHGDDGSFLDLNRAGSPLVEIVTMPVLKTPDEASEYLRHLRSIVRYLEISDGNLEEGSFRCDANVSIADHDDEVLGTRAEIKNLNSFKNIERAIAYEILRQTDILEEGGAVVQETRLFDAHSGKTRSMRSKEDSDDYRYLPDPDLPLIDIYADRIQAIQGELPELPQARVKRIQQQYGISFNDSRTITQERGFADYFEQIVQSSNKAKPSAAANWVTGEFLKEFKARSWQKFDEMISPNKFATLLELQEDGTISGKIAKVVFAEMAASGHDPKVIIQHRGLVQISDKKEIYETIARVLESNPAQVAQFLQGKEKILGFFVGQIMKQSQGKFNPGVVNEVLIAQLKAKKS